MRQTVTESQGHPSHQSVVNGCVCTVGCRRTGKFPSFLGLMGRAAAAAAAFLAFCRTVLPVQNGWSNQGIWTSLNIWAPCAVPWPYVYHSRSPLLHLCAHSSRQLGLKDPRAGDLWVSILLRKRLKREKWRQRIRELNLDFYTWVDRFQSFVHTCLP